MSEQQRPSWWHKREHELENRIEELERDLVEQRATARRALLFIRNAAMSGCTADEAREFFIVPAEEGEDMIG